jgi:hypothetical protein
MVRGRVFHVAGLLTDLTLQVALLAAPRGFAVAVRLLEGSDGTFIELRAFDPGRASSEFLSQLALHELERRGAHAVAQDFAREARSALGVDNSRVRRIRRIPARVRRARGTRSDREASG